MGAIALRRMLSLQSRHDGIGDVRGVGAMVAIELVDQRSSRAPSPGLTAAVLREAHNRGLALLRAGLYDNVIRLLMPLNIGDGELAAGLDILEQSFEAAVAASA